MFEELIPYTKEKRRFSIFILRNAQISDFLGIGSMNCCEIEAKKNPKTIQLFQVCLKG